MTNMARKDLSNLNNNNMVLEDLETFLETFLALIQEVAVVEVSKRDPRCFSKLM